MLKQRCDDWWLPLHHSTLIDALHRSDGVFFWACNVVHFKHVGHDCLLDVCCMIMQCHGRGGVSEPAAQEDYKLPDWPFREYY